MQNPISFKQHYSFWVCMNNFNRRKEEKYKATTTDESSKHEKLHNISRTTSSCF